MLKELSKKTVDGVIGHFLILILFVLVIAGCTINHIHNGMNEIDRDFTIKGWQLKCSDFRNDICYQAQWYNTTYNLTERQVGWNEVKPVKTNLSTGGMNNE